MVCKRYLVQVDSNKKVQVHNDSGTKKIKIYDVWQCDECEEPSGTPWLWKECETPYFVYVTFTGIVACSGMPAPPNGTKFKLWQINGPYSCVWYNPDDGSGWYVNYTAYDADAPGGSQLSLVRVASGKQYFLENNAADCVKLFQSNETDCAEPEFFEGEDGQGEVTWDTPS